MGLITKDIYIVGYIISTLYGIILINLNNRKKQTIYLFYGAQSHDMHCVIAEIITIQLYSLRTEC